MAAIPLSATAIAGIKTALRKEFPHIKSSHLSEAMAAALGFRTHASLLTSLSAQANDPSILLLSDQRFHQRLLELEILPDWEFSFDLMDEAPEIIATIDARLDEDPYRTARGRAWRNLIVLTVNEAIRLKLFSLRAGDNRWPGASERSNGPRFDFVLPNGLPALGKVEDIGFDEIAVHVVVNPKGRGLITNDRSFRAGDAWAGGWLERKLGAWLQSSTSQFSCRQALLPKLVDMSAEPLGYGDRGRVIM